MAPGLRAEVIEVDGFWVTSLSRTVLDLACGLQPLLAVPIGDAGLRAGRPPSSWRSGWPSPPIATASPGPGGRPRCWTPRSESPGESMSRVVFAEHRIPMPTPRLEIFDDWAASSPGSDFGWEEEQTLGGVDGQAEAPV